MVSSHKSFVACTFARFIIQILRCFHLSSFIFHFSFSFPLLLFSRSLLIKEEGVKPEQRRQHFKQRSLRRSANSSGRGQGLLQGGVADESARIAASIKTRATSVGVNTDSATVLLNSAARVTTGGVDGVVDAPDGRVLPAVGKGTVGDLLGLVPLNRVVELDNTVANDGGGDTLSGSSSDVGREDVSLTLPLGGGQASLGVLEAVARERERERVNKAQTKQRKQIRLCLTIQSTASRCQHPRGWRHESGRRDLGRTGAREGGAREHSLRRWRERGAPQTP